MIAARSRIIVSRPRFTQGGRSFAQDKVGRVQSITGRYCVIVLEGEKDQLGFFVDELDELC